MEKKIEDRIELYSAIYLKAFEKALKINSNNARYIQDVTLKFPSWKKLNILIISCK